MKQFSLHDARMENAMKLLLQSAMIFFGTLMAAAVVALGEPGHADAALTVHAAPQSRGSSLRHEITDSHLSGQAVWVRTGFGLR